MAKNKKPISSNPGASWSTRQLRAFIREGTKELNEHYKSIELSGANLKEDYPMQYQQRNKLIEVSGVAARGGKVGLGLAYKHKTALIIQARQVQQNLKYDLPYFEESARDSATKDAYKSFKKHHNSDLTFEEYKEVAEALGALGDDIIYQFGYDPNSDHSFMEMYAEFAHEEQKSAIDLVTATEDVIKESKGKGYTPEDLIDLLRRHLEE